MKRELLKSAGLELVKGNFGNAIKSFASSFIDPSNYRGSGNEWFIDASNGSIDVFGNGHIQQCLNFYKLP